MQQFANGLPRSSSDGAKHRAAMEGCAVRTLKEREGAESRRLHVPVLAVLTILFVFRVFAQLIQAQADLPYLPTFQSWDSGALPYEALVVAQCLIIGTMIGVTWRVWANRLSPRRPWHRLCLILGSIYFSVMFVRLVAGLTILGGMAWFSKPLPALFHLVLASFVLVVGHHLVLVAREGRAPGK